MELDAFIRLLESAHDEMDRRKREAWDRSLPLGDLVGDRWRRARELGFGEGTSIYDSAVVIGAVSVGRHCWIGPNVILDGSGGLTLGDYVAVGPGSFIASHSSLNHTLSGGEEPIQRRPTRIGSRVMISPFGFVEMGVTIGDGVFIGPHSHVTRNIGDGVIVYGAPQREVGRVTRLADGRVKLQWDRRMVLELMGRSSAAAG